MSQSEAVNDPAEIVERQVTISIPRCWRKRDIITLIETWHGLTEDPTKRPSESPEIVEELMKLTSTAVEEPPKKKQKKKDSIFTEREEALRGILNRRAKLHMIRHFTIESPDTIIAEVYGDSFKLDSPFKHNIVRKRMLNAMYQIKHTTLDLARKHVEAAMEKGGRPIRTNRDRDTIREFFSKLYSKENLLAVFSWIEPILDLEKCPKRVHNFLHNVYANLCTFVKFNLRDQNCAEWGRTALVLYWDRLGKSESWKKVRVEHFIALEPSIKKGKSKLADERNFVQIDEDTRFGVLKGLYDVSSDIDSDSDSDSDGDDIIPNTPNLSAAVRTSAVRTSAVRTSAAVPPPISPESPIIRRVSGAYAGSVSGAYAGSVSGASQRGRGSQNRHMEEEEVESEGETEN